MTNKAKKTSDKVQKQILIVHNEKKLLQITSLLHSFTSFSFKIRDCTLRGIDTLKTVKRADFILICCTLNTVENARLKTFLEKNPNVPVIVIGSDMKISVGKTAIKYLQWDILTEQNLMKIVNELDTIKNKKMNNCVLSKEMAGCSDERYAAALHGSNIGIWDWDLTKGKIFFCDQWKKILGLKMNGTVFLPDDWFSRIHSEDLEYVKEQIGSHLKGETVQFSCEYRMLHKSRKYIWVLSRGIVLRDKKGKSIRFAGTQSEITAQKVAEQEQKQSLDELKFALASEKILMEELDKKNKELVELSITDGLTGLYNHRFLQERFDFEFKRVRRYGGELSCMLIDIDHFKSINDTYGHQFGDLVLKQIASLMKQNSRDIDICGRYGGEEFLVIANLKLENALIYAKKLHSAIENHIFKNENASIHVTVSIGVAGFKTDIKTKQEFIERADKALYQAKSDGRNLIRVWKKDEPEDGQVLDKFGLTELKSKFVELSEQLNTIYSESANALLKAAEKKDSFAREHSKNVAEYAVKIARSMQLSKAEIEMIHYAALLHDIGKAHLAHVEFPKKGRSGNRVESYMRHPEYGVALLKDVQLFEKEAPLILHHHERFDGTGFPHELQGREIPLGSRIIAVADAFDNLISGRWDSSKITFDQALYEIKKGSGTQFSPDIVEVFARIVNA